MDMGSTAFLRLTLPGPPNRDKRQLEEDGNSDLVLRKAAATKATRYQGQYTTAPAPDLSLLFLCPALPYAAVFQPVSEKGNHPRSGNYQTKLKETKGIHWAKKMSAVPHD